LLKLIQSISFKRVVKIFHAIFFFLLYYYQLQFLEDKKSMEAKLRTLKAKQTEALIQQDEEKKESLALADQMASIKLENNGIKADTESRRHVYKCFPYNTLQLFQFYLE